MKVDVHSLTVEKNPEAINALLAMISSRHTNKPHRFVMVDAKYNRTKFKHAKGVFDMIFGEVWNPLQDRDLLFEYIDKFDIDCVKIEEGVYRATISSDHSIYADGITRVEAIAKAAILFEFGEETFISDETELL